MACSTPLQWRDLRESRKSYGTTAYYGSPVYGPIPANGDWTSEAQGLERTCGAGDRVTGPSVFVERGDAGSRRPAAPGSLCIRRSPAGCNRYCCRQLPTKPYCVTRRRRQPSSRGNAARCLLTLMNPRGLMYRQFLPSHLGVTLLTDSGNNWGQLGY